MIVGRVVVVCVAIGGLLGVMGCSGGSTDICEAAGDGDDAAVQKCLDRGVNPDTRNRDGWTALHCAANYGETAVVATLLRGGASINAPTQSSGRSALHLAASEGHLETVRVLLQAGADQGMRDYCGATAETDAIRLGRAECARLLREPAAGSGTDYTRHSARP